MVDLDVNDLSDMIVDLMTKEGCNCAEAMIKTMAKRFGFDPGLSRFGTVFGAGISRNADFCGLMSGGLLVISLRFGRVNCEARDKEPKTYEVGSEYYRWFLDNHGKCCDIKGDPTVGPYDKCHEVARKAVPFLISLMEKHRS